MRIGGLQDEAHFLSRIEQYAKAGISVRSIGFSSVYKLVGATPSRNGSGRDDWR
jgi:hypothetical protein